jgi:hypothetical protein
LLLLALGTTLPGMLAAAALPPWSIALLYGDREIYPSALVCTADASVFPPQMAGFWHLGDPAGLVGVQLTAPRDDCPVKVVLAATELYDRTEVTVRLPRQGQRYRVAPWLKLDHARLVAIRHPIASEVIRAELTIDGVTEAQTYSVRVHSINDCLTAVAQGAHWYETAFLAAAYINEYNTDVIDPLTDLARRRHGVVFDGYNSGDPEQVIRQVAALYQAMQDSGFKFSTIAQSSVPMSRRSMSQTIRLNSDTLATRQANCVDGTALMAAVLTRVGLRAVMFFIVHEHIFLGVYLTPRGPEREGFLVVETTAVGRYPFTVACDAGRKKLAEIRRSIREVRLGPGPLPALYNWNGYQQKGERGFFTVDVAMARARGIWPIAEPAAPRTEEAFD